MNPTSNDPWLLISTVLLTATVPGVALFYGGMVRKKNVISTIGLPFVSLALISVLWMGIGALGRLPVFDALPAESGWGADSLVGERIMLAGALALALAAGGVVERIRLPFFLAFGFLWIMVVFAPIAWWFWGGGWLSRVGSLDFAGGAVIHLSAGVSAVVASVLLGPRTGYGRVEMKPNHLPLSVCGMGLLWMGWCGFSGGFGPTSVKTAAGAFVVTQIAAATAASTWTVAEWLQRDKPTVLGTVSGAVAGLVAVAPAAGYVGPLSALVIGLGAGGFCYMTVNFVKLILGYDDSLDVFGMHAVGGTWGMVATGLFASVAVNPDGSDGLFFGYPYQLLAQGVAVAAVWAWSGVMTAGLIVVLRRVCAPRVTREAEVMGLDLAQHGERAYS
jgi:Amt family ammonium transporter